MAANRRLQKALPIGVQYVYLSDVQVLKEGA